MSCVQRPFANMQCVQNGMFTGQPWLLPSFTQLGPDPPAVLVLPPVPAVPVLPPAPAVPVLPPAPAVPVLPVPPAPPPLVEPLHAATHAGTAASHCAIAA